MITETYRDVEIVLLEEENKWRFTANGRERTAPSTVKAREFIDSALDAVATKKEKPFEAIPVCYMPPYPDSNDVEKIGKGRITSIADKNYRGEPVVWATTKYRGREKTDLTYFCADSPENDAIFARLQKLAKQEEEIAEQFRGEAAKIERVKLTAD